MTMDVSKTEPSRNGAAQQQCAGCNKPITERYLLRALDMFWHEDCLKCGCCDCRLGEVGSTCYTKANLILCKRDYLRLFGNTGHCAACSKAIPAFEMVMRARTNVYHLECFACQQCNHRFCVGDRFYLCENKILCEYDYEERLMFANMALHPPTTATLAHIKRQTVTAGGGAAANQQQQQQQQRQTNGIGGAVNDSASGHNGYPGVPTSSSSSGGGLGALAGLNNGLGGPQPTGYEAK
ncbi:LIM domain only protein 3 isoform X2 [Nasonia vitripennis]|uniref:LIM zinc-binding domain-containing protein n=1 Tax=Nasonia vitripennis TaxID=7425 RepID=A0A7M7H4K0_NASVI|nr:LIM domain only protein 3 isoform X2 [Nasonia vitripennis]XP_032454092.1 LIM domain only protein 3 isoform X2 [Nasonia vitripennis]